jgi:alkylhydroperoxidase family enzyme
MPGLRDVAVPAGDAQGFVRGGLCWSSWLPLGAGLGDDLSSLLLCLPDLADPHAAIEAGLSHPAKSGLLPGERALARTASARLNGNLAGAAEAASAAAFRLKRSYEVDLLLREGAEVPLTGRLGAIIAAAGLLASTPPVISASAVRRLRSNGLSEDEMVEVVLAAAFAAWTDRLALSLGEAVPLTV